MDATHSGLVVADVSGNGVGSALLMAETRAYLRALASTHLSIGDILTRANAFLCSDTDDDRFVTLFLAHLDIEHRTVTHAGAGHHGYYIPANGTPIRILSTGLPLGMEESTVYPTGETLQLCTGDILLAFTDGIAETRAPNGELFGWDNAAKLVAQHRHLSAEELVSNLFDWARDFAQVASLHDDMTALVVKCVDVAS
jgi:sigma-B regulation protein RsbU (phosphoserine phosphatase)